MDPSDVNRHGSRWSSRDSFWLESGQAKWIYRVSDVIENYHVTGIYLLALRKLNYLVGPPKLGQRPLITTPTSLETFKQEIRHQAEDWLKVSCKKVIKLE